MEFIHGFDDFALKNEANTGFSLLKKNFEPFPLRIWNFAEHIISHIHAKIEISRVANPESDPMVSLLA